ncbi:MAG: hypothetical protein HY920_08820, partial [Elusimicrobia bacterium]|nr:hypothetical protein [Elusimicrobiota bacterium]
SARFLADFAGGSLGRAQAFLEKGILEKKAELDEFVEGMPGEDIAAVLARAQAYGRDKEQAKIWLDLLLYACARRYRSVRELPKPGAEREEEISELILRAKRDLAVNVNLQLVLENIFLRMRHA